MNRLFLPVIFHFTFQGCTKTIPTLLGSGKITTTSTSIVVFAITTQLAEVVPTSYKKNRVIARFCQNIRSQGRDVNTNS